MRLQSRHRNVLILLWAVGLLLLLLTWAHVYVLGTQSREREVGSAERDLSNLTRAAQEHAVRTFRSADQVIRFVQSRYKELGDKLDLSALTQQGVIDAEIFNQIGIIDARGIYVLANRPITSRLDLSDREHYKVHVNQDNGQLFVSKPVIGRATGKWSIQLTRRINNPDGSFGGVVVLSIDPTYFTEFYGALNLGPGGLTALYGLDGIARARRVGNQAEFGSDASRSVLFERLVREQPSGSYIQQSVVDGVERMYFYRTIPGYSMVSLAAVDMRFLMANHEKSMQALLLQAGLVSLLILALVAGMTRYLGLLRQDAQARKAAQVQIQERTEQLNAVFEISPDGFVSFDQNFCVKFVNPAFRQMTGLGSMALEGMDENDFSAWLASLCDPASRFSGLRTLRSKMQDKAVPALETIELKELGHLILQVQLRLSESGTVSQILYVRDITHETEVDRMKSEFLSMAAHELRTPMASIYGYAELLLSQEFDEEMQKDLLETIFRQAALMVSIINELLDLSRIEARRGMDFVVERLLLSEIVGAAVAGYKPPNGRETPVLVEPDEAIYVSVDRKKIEQSLLNILSNAYKYSPNGGEVSLTYSKNEDPGFSRIGIKIRDHGIGMNALELNRVCERFYRADTSGKIPGTGLGMSIVKEIIELHGGEVVLESRPGEGSTVTLWLPLA
mgnify:CR=1 FL=1